VHAKLVDRVSPLFCHNHVVHHKPYVFKKQFGFHDVDIDVNAFNCVDYEIKLKDNQGQFPHDYFKNYEKELKIWEDCICFNDFSLIGHLRTTCSRHQGNVGTEHLIPVDDEARNSYVDAEVDLEVEHTGLVDEPQL
jgi:hypothetical protein